MYTNEQLTTIKEKLVATQANGYYGSEEYRRYFWDFSKLQEIPSEASMKFAILGILLIAISVILVLVLLRRKTKAKKLNRISTAISFLIVTVVIVTIIAIMIFYINVARKMGLTDFGLSYYMNEALLQYGEVIFFAIVIFVFSHITHSTKKK